MKKNKALLPVLAGVLLISLGLGACNSKPAASGQQGGSDASNLQASEPVEAKINITAEGGKKEIIVGETLQLHADVDGVEWSTKSEGIISVDSKGLVTALGAGAGRVTARKDGYANGTYTITVNKAPEKQWQYEVRLEQADHYDPDDFWGMDLSAYGYGIMGPGDSPIENNNGATDDSTSLGYLQTGCKETMTFTCDKAVEVELGVTMAYNAETALQGVIAVKFNNVDIPMTGILCEGPEDENNQNYYDFHAVSFGKVNLIAGNNVLEIEVLGQVAPNMDKVVIWTDQTLQIAAVPAVAKPKIEVVEAELAVEVESKVQIQVKDNLAGVEFKSADETIATVSATGEVTGVKAGKTSIELTKEGYKKASVTVTVKNKPVAGQIILEAEEGTLGGTARVENDANASGGARVGYLSADTSLTLKATLTEAGEYAASFMAYSNNVSDWTTYPNVTAEELVLSSCMTLTLNGTPIDLTDKVLPGGAWGTWVSVELGDLSLSVGENTFVFAFTAQGPNIDYLKLVNKNGGQVEPPVVEQVTVSFDANGGTGEMTSVKVDKGSQYTLPECTFTAPADKAFAGWEVTTYTEWQGQLYPQTQVKQAGDKIAVSADMTIKATWKATSIIVTFDANGGTGSMDPVTMAPGDYQLPANGFTAPADRVFAGWEVTTYVEWYGQMYPQTKVQQPGETVKLDADITIKATWKVVITKSEQVDLTDAFIMEAEDATIEGAKNQQGGSPVENNESSHGGKDVGYMAKDATITFNFNASAAGQVKMILMGRSASADWSNWQNPVYYDHALEETTSIKVNNVDVDVTGKGFLGSDAKTSVQVDLGNITVNEGPNTIVITALAQAPNFDCIALISGTSGIVLSLPQA